MSGLTGFIGMSLAVRGNVRTAAAARSGELAGALRVAFRTGGYGAKRVPPLVLESWRAGLPVSVG